MDQSKLESKIEVIVDTLTGIGLSWLMMLYIIPLFYPDYRPPVAAALGIVLLFTTLSLVRKYFWRRFFSVGLHRLVHRYVTGILRT